MHIPVPLALGIQRWLLSLCHGCTYADSLANGLIKFGDKKCVWQWAVDTVYRLLISGLIEASSEKSVDIDERNTEYAEYARRLAMSDPFSNELHVHVEWMLWDLCATDLCKSLVDKHQIGPNDEERVCEAFIRDVESLFEAAGVPWTSEPLFSIR